MLSDLAINLRIFDPNSALLGRLSSHLSKLLAFYDRESAMASISIPPIGGGGGQSSVHMNPHEIKRLCDWWSNRV